MTTPEREELTALLAKLGESREPSIGTDGNGRYFLAESQRDREWTRVLISGPFTSQVLGAAALAALRVLAGAK